MYCLCFTSLQPKTHPLEHLVNGKIPRDYTIDHVVVVLGDCLTEHRAECFRDNDVTGWVLMMEGDDKEFLLLWESALLSGG